MGIKCWALGLAFLFVANISAFGQASSPSAPEKITRKFAALEKLRPVKTKPALTGTDNGGELTLRRRGREELLIFWVGLSNRFVEDCYYCRDNHLLAYRRVETRLLGIETGRPTTLGKPKVISAMWLTPTSEVRQSGDAAERPTSWASVKEDYLFLAAALRSASREADFEKRITGK